MLTRAHVRRPGLSNRNFNSEITGYMKMFLNSAFLKYFKWKCLCPCQSISFNSRFSLVWTISFSDEVFAIDMLRIALLCVSCGICRRWIVTEQQWERWQLISCVCERSRPVLVNKFSVVRWVDNFNSLFAQVQPSENVVFISTTFLF